MSIIISQTELMTRPITGTSWNYVLNKAKSTWPAPNAMDQNNKTGSLALAAGLVFARTGDAAMKTKARNAIIAWTKTFKTGLTNGVLSIGRQTASYVMTADLIGLDGADKTALQTFLRKILTDKVGTHSRWNTIKGCHEDSDNNWGGWAGSARIAADIYLGDTTDLARAEKVVRGFLGERAAYTGFKGQGSKNPALNAATKSWACDPSPTGYVPTNGACTGKSGAFPSDIQRDNAKYPTIGSSGKQYQNETLAGYMLAVELLFQNGYSSIWVAGNNAMKRVGDFMTTKTLWNPGSVQYHIPWLLNKRLGTSYPKKPAQYGRSFGYTDWLYG